MTNRTLCHARFCDSYTMTPCMEEWLESLRPIHLRTVRKETTEDKARGFPLAVCAVHHTGKSVEILRFPKENNVTSTDECSTSTRC